MTSSWSAITPRDTLEVSANPYEHGTDNRARVVCMIRDLEKAVTKRSIFHWRHFNAFCSTEYIIFGFKYLTAICSNDPINITQTMVYIITRCRTSDKPVVPCIPLVWRHYSPIQLKFGAMHKIRLTLQIRGDWAHFFYISGCSRSEPMSRDIAYSTSFRDLTTRGLMVIIPHFTLTMSWGWIRVAWSKVMIKSWSESIKQQKYV